MAAKHPLPGIQGGEEGDVAASAAAALEDAAAPLEAEAHWRLYQNAAFVRGHLEQLVASEGLNLQEFMFHV